MVKDGTIIESGVLLAAGAQTEPGQRVTSGWVWAGRPARPRSALAQNRIDEVEDIVRGYIEYARNYAVTVSK